MTDDSLTPPTGSDADDPHATGSTEALVRTYRLLLFSVAGALPALLVVLWIALDGQVTGSLDDPLPWILVGAGTIGTMAGHAFARRQILQARDLASFISFHRIAFFIGLASAEVPALLGFVASFLIEALWPFLVGLVPAMIGLWMVAPTAERFRSYDNLLRSRGVKPSDLLRPEGTGQL